MNRRDFFRNSTAATTCLALAPEVIGQVLDDLEPLTAESAKKIAEAVYPEKNGIFPEDDFSKNNIDGVWDNLVNHFSWREITTVGEFKAVLISTYHEVMKIEKHYCQNFWHDIFCPRYLRGVFYSPSGLAFTAWYVLEGRNKNVAQK